MKKVSWTNILITGAVILVLVVVVTVRPSGQTESEITTPSTLGLDKVTKMTVTYQPTDICLSQESGGDLVLVSKDGPTGTYFATRAKEVAPGEYQLIGEPIPIVGEPIKIGP